MARAYAQLAAVVFLIVGFAGFFTGDAGRVAGGQAGGNFDGVALHLTYLHDVVHLLIGAALAYAGWFAEERVARATVLGVAGVLLLLAIIGFIVNDDDAGTRSIITLHFPVAVNIFHLVAGTLGALCALGDVSDPETVTS
jgi:hypothetical protein